MMSSSSFGIKRSTAYQLALFALAVLVSGAAVLVYPDPKAPPPPKSSNVIEIVALIRSTPLDAPAKISPAPNVLIQFFAVGEQGQVPGVTVETRTNNSGLARVRLEKGLYVVKYGDSGVKNIIVTKNSTLTITRYDIDEAPVALKVLSLSKDWQLSPADYLLVTYKNKLNKPVLVQEALLGGKSMQSIKCKLQAQEGQEADDYGGGAALCEVKTRLEAAGDWNNILAIPEGVYMPWSSARESVALAIRISYTEAEFKPNEGQVQPQAPAAPAGQR